MNNIDNITNLADWFGGKKNLELFIIEVQKKDKEYGPDCDLKAIGAFNGKDLIGGNEKYKRLIVKNAINK